MVWPRVHVSASSAPPGRTYDATSAIAYRTRYPPPSRRLRCIAWSRSRDDAGSMVTNGTSVRSVAGIGVALAASSASRSASGGNSVGRSSSRRMTEKSMRGAQTLVIGTGHSYQAPTMRPSLRSCGAGLAFLPRPAGILGVPLRIAPLDRLECPRGVVSGGVGTEPVLRGTHVVAGLDGVVAEAPEIAAPAGPTIAHATTVHLMSAMRHRFTQRALVSIVERRSQCDSAAISSAIWTALRAAPLRRLSLETKNAKPFSTVSSARIRPTYEGSRPAACSGVGMSDSSTPGAPASNWRA